MRDYERERAQMKAWLDGLKPGDEVVARVMGEWRSREDVRRVTRRTARQIFLEPTGARSKEGRVRAEDGRLLGERGVIRPITKTDREESERERLTAEIVHWTNNLSRWPKDVPLDVLRAVATAIKGGGGA